MNLTIDFETRSTVDLKKTSAWVYAEHATTDVQCLGVKVDDEPSRIWLPPRVFATKYGAEVESRRVLYTDVINLCAKADTITAHNVGFERALWTGVCHARFDWPRLPEHKLRCTAAKAAACALPRSLGEVTKVLGLAVQKDPAGYAVMMRMCKPRRQKDPAAPIEWNEDPDDFDALFRYCMQDCDAERALDKALPDLTDYELKVWQLDQRINCYGVAIDQQWCRDMIAMVEEHTLKLLAEWQELTGGRVNSPKQIAATLEMLDGEEGLKLESLDKASVAEALMTDLSARSRRLLEIRKSLGKASTAKFKAMLRFSCSDSRARETLMYHGANTGRWAGKGIQPQNMARGQFKDVDLCRKAYVTGGLDAVGLLYGDPMVAASTCCRGAMAAGDGKVLLAGDFKSIEGCVLAWIAEETPMVEAYRAGKVYEMVAGWVYGKMPSEISRAERQVGKVAELALGYQGGVGALDTMCEGYGIELETTLKEEIVGRWRANRPITVAYWHEIEKMAKSAVAKPGRVVVWRNVGYCFSPPYLLCKLPSGRKMRYFNPSLVTDVEHRSQKLVYWGVDSYTKKWCEIHTYGGKLVENIVQAVARDLLADSMLRHNAAGYSLVLHVHDEIVAEEAPGSKGLEEFLKIMAEAPAWAAGCPIAAEGWEGKRYRKG